MSEEATERPNSVEITINAKGSFGGKVKVYAETIDDAMKAAKEKAEELEEFIKTKNEVLR